MKNKILSIAVLILATCLWACEEEDGDWTTPSTVNVNGGPVMETVTPTSVQVKIVLSQTTGVKETGVYYGVQSDRSALITYGEVQKTENIDTVVYLDLENLESATTYYYVAYAMFQDGSTSAYSVVREFETQSAELYLTPMRMTRPASAGKDTVKVSTTFDTWSIADYDYPWVSATKEDSLLILTYEDNIETEARIASFKVMAGSRTQSFTLTQKIPELSLEIEAKEVSSKGETGKFVVTSDVAWNVYCEETWCVPTVKDDSVFYTADPNTGEDERKAYIVVKVSESLSKVFTITQRSGALALPVTKLEFGLMGGESGFPVESAATWEVKSNADWCTVKAVTEDSAAVSIKPNSTSVNKRSATVTVTSAGRSKTLTVQQASGLSMKDSGEMRMTWGNNDQSALLVRVYCYTTEWTCSIDDPEHFEVTKTNDSTVLVHPKTINIDATPIKAKLSVAAGTLTQTFDLEQPIAVFGLPAEVKLGYAATTKVLQTKGDGISYTDMWIEDVIVPDDAKTWLTATVTGGNEFAGPQITLVATENSTGATRTAVIVAKWRNVTEEITVSQADKSTVVTLPDLTPGILAGTYQVTAGGIVNKVTFGSQILTKAEYDAIADKNIADDFMNYENGGGKRFEVMKSMDYDYAIGLNGGIIYPLLFKMTNVESMGETAPEGAYEVKILCIEEPANQSGDGTNYMFKTNEAWYDPVTKTLYFDFNYWNENYIRTLVLAE